MFGDHRVNGDLDLLRRARRSVRGRNVATAERTFLRVVLESRVEFFFGDIVPLVTVMSRLPTGLAFLSVRVLTVFAASGLVSRRFGNIAGRWLGRVS